MSKQGIVQFQHKRGNDTGTREEEKRNSSPFLRQSHDKQKEQGQWGGWISLSIEDEHISLPCHKGSRQREEV